MQKLKLMLARLNSYRSAAGAWLAKKARMVLNYSRKEWHKIGDYFTVIAMVIGLLALLALVFYAVRPIKTAAIKVPVATDLTSYYPGQTIKGIFFGDTYYTGQVRILREVFCENYKGVIKPPAESAAGDFFATQAKPRHLEGDSVTIGNLPDDAPEGKNCVLQFTNVYDVQTPFGVRHIEYQYYTQNFGIVTKERRCDLDRQANLNDTTACNGLPKKAQQQDATQPAPTVQSNPGSSSYNGGGASSTTNNYYSTTENNTTNNPPADQPSEPVTPPQQTCTINLLGVKAFCRDE